MAPRQHAKGNMLETRRWCDALKEQAPERCTHERMLHWKANLEEVSPRSSRVLPLVKRQVAASGTVKTRNLTQESSTATEVSSIDDSPARVLPGVVMCASEIQRFRVDRYKRSELASGEGLLLTAWMFTHPALRKNVDMRPRAVVLPAQGPPVRTNL